MKKSLKNKYIALLELLKVNTYKDSMARYAKLFILNLIEKKEVLLLHHASCTYKIKANRRIYAQEHHSFYTCLKTKLFLKRDERVFLLPLFFQEKKKKSRIICNTLNQVEKNFSNIKNIISFIVKHNDLNLCLKNLFFLENNQELLEFFIIEEFRI